MKIESNIDTPTGRVGRPAKYPFREMSVGDSIFFDDQPKGSQSNPAVAARVVARDWGWSFVTRKEGSGVRIWRAS